MCLSFFLESSDYETVCPEFSVTDAAIHAFHRLLDSLVVECWLRVWEVSGSIPSQGPRHTKDIIKVVPVVYCLFSTQQRKREILALSQELR